MGLEIARLLREKEVDETPQGGFPEEARQLARGKRVISRPTFRFTIDDGTSLYKINDACGNIVKNIIEYSVE
ncbi:hypothetical protein GCM10011389_21640 [Pontibacillus salipaludis]|uniref:Uncharacterized protein n=1 Tax=Pontibacillus salipaludis TaxID=1697394 RepID=A0ABQ1Q631_9BACI|nr:hypothetical protein GCM10011389_21640 [Pontibacillus salipaludis]